MSDLDGNPEDRISHDAAQTVLWFIYFTLCVALKIGSFRASGNLLHCVALIRSTSSILLKLWNGFSKRLESYKNHTNRFSSISRWSKYLKNARDDWEVRRLLPENDNVTIYTLKSFMLLKVGMFCPRCIDIK